MSKINNISDDLFKEYFYKSETLSELAKKIGYKITGSVYNTLRTKINKLSLSTEHLKGKSWMKNKDVSDNRIAKQSKSNSLSWADMFCSNCKRHSQSLLKRLIDAKIRSYKCEICSIESWNNQKIILQIHHKDGNKLNNNECNLQILCPNCHSQTSNFCGRNNGNFKPKNKSCIKCCDRKAIYLSYKK